MIAVLSGLSEHVSWLQAWCGRFGDGCRETAQVMWLGVPIWIWGAVFYAVTILSVWFMRRATSGLVAAGLGVEATLVWMMVSAKIVCIFCLANLLVMILLAVAAFEKRALWPMLSFGLLGFLVSSLSIQQGETRFAPMALAEERERVAARIGSEVITTEKLEGLLTFRLHDLEMEIYRAKRDLLEQMIVEKVLQKEADRRGISLDQLAGELMQAQKIAVSEAEVERYYQENRPRWADWRGSEDELRNRVRGFLEQQKRYQLVADYAESLYGKYDVSIELKEPKVRLGSLSTPGSQVLGSAEMPVTIFEFSDYQCPVCRRAHEVVKQVREAYRGKVRWVFKDYPLKQHKNSDMAAEAARCVAEQGKFWEYQDILYAAEGELTRERLEQYAGQLGVASEPFVRCLEEGRYRKAVQKDVEEARAVGVDRTPTFIINGELMTGSPTLDRFKTLIDAQLERAQQKP